MDFYYRKLMGNGAITSKFRVSSLVGPTFIQLKQSNLRGKAGDDELKNDSNETSRSTSAGEQIVTSESSSIVGSESTVTDKSESRDSSNESTLEASDSIEEPVSRITIPSILELEANLNNSETPIETSKTHHPNNCNRCYRLKKKCSREYPKCSTCHKTGSECEYIIRSNKRRKRVDRADKVVFKVNGKYGGDLNEESPKKRSNFEHRDLIDESKNLPVTLVTVKKVSTPTPKLQHPDITSPSPTSPTLQHPNSQVVFINGDSEKSYPPKKPSNSKVIKKSLTTTTFSTNLKEEFVTIPAIKNPELPHTFIRNYFENFSSRYPFLNKTKILESLANANFEQELIVNLDTYLVMSIGCLVYDKLVFQEIFSEKNIESVIDVLDLDMEGALEVEITDNLTLLLLLNIYSIVSLNSVLAWNVLSLLTKLVLQLHLYRGTHERIVWSVHNLDSELSLLYKRPGLFPRAYNKSEIPKAKLYEDEDLSLVALEIEYCKMSSTILDLKLRADLQIEDLNQTNLQEISERLERWRVSLSSSVNASALFQDTRALINLNYFYLHVELDQLSPIELLQFVFQFLSNSFSLLISENAKNEKDNLRILLQSSLTWFIKLNNVIRYTLVLMLKMLSSTRATLETSLKLNEFNSNLQLIVNLLRYVKEGSLLKGDNGVEVLHRLSLQLSGFDLLLSRNGEKEVLTAEIEKVRLRFCKAVIGCNRP